jgi:hypothetical protein
MSVTFEEAQEIVKKQIQVGFVVANWGNENDQWWEIQAGDQRYLVDFDDEYASFDDICYLVRKSDGHYETKSFASNMEFFDDFKPYGDVPSFFK